MEELFVYYHKKVPLLQRSLNFLICIYCGIMITVMGPKLMNTGWPIIDIPLV